MGYNYCWMSAVKNFTSEIRPILSCWPRSLADDMIWFPDVSCFVVQCNAPHFHLKQPTTYRCTHEVHFWIHAWSRFRLMPPCCNSKKNITLWGEDSWPFNHQQLNRTRFWTSFVGHLFLSLCLLSRPKDKVPSNPQDPFHSLSHVFTGDLTPINYNQVFALCSYQKKAWHKSQINLSHRLSTS